MNYEQALHKSAAYCSQAEHCTYELTEKMNRWEVTPGDQKAILAYLEKENYLSNIRYARAFVRDKFRYNKWGKIRIQLELQRRQIEGDLIEEALNTLEEEEYRNQAVELAKSKLRGLKYTNNYERDGKIYRFLAGRGYESATIREALLNLNPKTD